MPSTTGTRRTTAPSGYRFAEPAATWWETFEAHRDLYMAPQARGWTCSVCSTDWTLRATGLDPDSDRIKVALEIGYPNCVNAAVGLANTQCIVDVFESHGVDAVQQWVDFDQAYEVCASTAGVINGLGMYHFMAIRGVSNGRLWVANSAEGYRGVGSYIDRNQFDAQGLDPWQVVYLKR